MANVNNTKRIEIGAKLQNAKTFDDLREFVSGLTDDELNDLRTTLQRANDYVGLTMRDITIMNQCHYEAGVRGESKTWASVEC